MLIHHLSSIVALISPPINKLKSMNESSDEVLAAIVNRLIDESADQLVPAADAIGYNNYIGVLLFVFTCSVA